VIRVLIVDDHPLVRLGVATLLAQADGITVVGECSDGGEVVDVAIMVDPDVVLMDIHMPGTSGLDATRALLKTRPTARVLMFTASTVAGHIEDAASAGAVGYLFKGGDARALLIAVRAVAAGKAVWPGHVMGVWPIGCD
jgi:DNA-binding NarL/FixJ family response regulator